MIVDDALLKLSRRVHAMYCDIGRPSIAPGKLLRVAAAGLLYGSKRAAVDGGDELQTVVSLICGLNTDDGV